MWCGLRRTPASAGLATFSELGSRFLGEVARAGVPFGAVPWCSVGEHAHRRRSRHGVHDMADKLVPVPGTGIIVFANLDGFIFVIAAWSP
jgi:hypothetical protein